MSNKFIIPGPPVVGAAASTTCTADLIIGPRYHVIWLEFLTGTITSGSLSLLAGLIRLKVNGRVQRQVTATELNAINTLNGSAYRGLIYSGASGSGVGYTSYGYVGHDGVFYTAAGSSTLTSAAYYVRIPIFLAEPWRKQYAATDLMAWPTQWANGKGLIGTFQLEVALGSGAQTNGLKVINEVDYQTGAIDANGNPVLQVSRWNQYNFTLTASATDQEYYITTLPRADIYQQLSFFSSNAAGFLTGLKVKVENNLIRDVTRGLMDISNLAREMNPANSADLTQAHVVFDFDDMPNSALPMVYAGRQVQDFQVIPRFTCDSTARTVELVYQTFGPLA